MHQTSRKYHRQPQGPRLRFQVSGGGGASSSISRPEIISPFGQQPYNTAGRFGGNFSDPLSSLLGFGPSSGAGSKFYGQEMSQLGDATGPLADYIRQMRGFLPGVFGQAQQVGTTAATQAPLLYNQVQGQVGDVLGKLPDWNNIASQITQGAVANQGAATTAVNQAFSPVVNNALFSNANRNAIDLSRASGGARGLVDSGTQQAQEENITRNQASDFAQQQFQNQQAAIAGAGNAAGAAGGALAGQLATGTAGIPVAQAGQAGLPDYIAGLASQFGIPMDAMNQVFSSLSGAASPGLSLLSQILPQIAQVSKSHAWNTQQSAGL